MKRRCEHGVFKYGKCEKCAERHRVTVPEGAVTGVAFRDVDCTCWAWRKGDEPQWHWPDCSRVPRPPSKPEALAIALTAFFDAWDRCDDARGPSNEIEALRIAWKEISDGKIHALIAEAAP